MSYVFMEDTENDGYSIKVLQAEMTAEEVMD